MSVLPLDLIKIIGMFSLLSSERVWRHVRVAGTLIHSRL